jgi:hypothetical protein
MDSLTTSLSVIYKSSAISAAINPFESNLFMAFLSFE